MKISNKFPNLMSLPAMAVTIGLLSNPLTFAQPTLQKPATQGLGAMTNTRSPQKTLPVKTGNAGLPTPLQGAQVKSPTRNATALESKDSKVQKEDSSLSQGNSNGGGGHVCKSQAQLFVDNISAVMEQDPALASRYPEWATMKSKLDPQQNPGFVIRILKNPIQGCPNTENALACGRPRLNTLELYCGENGWNALPLKEKYKQIIHELYWWTSLDDTNYFHSGKMINEIFEKIKSESSNQTYIRLNEGDITSIDSMLNRIDMCEPANLYTNKGIWQDVNGALTCIRNPKNNYYNDGDDCSVEYSMDFSVVINKRFTLHVSTNTKQSLGATQAEFPKGTIFSKRECLHLIRKDYYTKKSLSWFKSLSDVQTGELTTYDKKGQKTCYKKFFEASYDPVSGEIGAESLRDTLAKCP